VSEEARPGIDVKRPSQNWVSGIAAAGSGASRGQHLPVVREGQGMRRFPVVALAGPDLHLYETVVFLGERNLAGKVGVTRYSGNTMSDDQNHSLDLTQWIEVEAAPDGGILAGVGKTASSSSVLINKGSLLVATSDYPPLIDRRRNSMRR
jgi:hypothetical protein